MKDEDPIDEVIRIIAENEAHDPNFYRLEEDFQPLYPAKVPELGSHWIWKPDDLNISISVGNITWDGTNWNVRAVHSKGSFMTTLENFWLLSEPVYEPKKKQKPVEKVEHYEPLDPQMLYGTYPSFTQSYVAFGTIPIVTGISGSRTIMLPDFGQQIDES